MLRQVEHQGDLNILDKRSAEMHDDHCVTSHVFLHTYFNHFLSCYIYEKSGEQLWSSNNKSYHIAIWTYDIILCIIEVMYSVAFSFLLHNSTVSVNF